MPTYLVRGADRETGENRSVELEAPSEPDAELLAQARGILVNRVAMKVTAAEMREEMVARGVPVQRVPAQQPASPADTRDLPRPRGVSRSRVTLAACAAAGMVATFLPWIQAPLIGGVPGSRGDGWFTFVGFAIILAVATSPNPRAPLRRGRRVVCSLFGAGCAALAVWKVLQLMDLVATQELEGGLAASFANSTSVGAGLWLVLICGVVATAAALVLRDGARA